MLSRVAESIYWLSRYIERAENVARVVQVNLNMMLEAGEDPQQWWPLVNTTGDHEDFKKRFGEANQHNVIQFLTFDPANPNSIISCLRAARENGRSVREIISSEMWLQLNKFYLMVNEAAARHRIDSPNEFYSEIKLASHLFAGITDATMSHGEAWHFSRLGRKLERADKTSRLLDVKYFILLRSVADVGTPMDDTQWASVLRSVSAFEMYRKRHGRISPKGIVQFLLLDQEFPRAVHFCFNAARESLRAISGTQAGSTLNSAEECIRKLCSDFSNAQVDGIVSSGLHEYLDDLQTRMNLLGVGIHQTFFAKRIPESGKDPHGQRGQCAA